MRHNEVFDKIWCKMVFEDRNTEYGAYKIRKETGSRYGKALGCIGFLFFITFAPMLGIFVAMNSSEKPNEDIIDSIPKFEGIRIKEARPMRRPPKKSEPVLVENSTIEFVDIEDNEEMATVEQKEEEEIIPEKIVDVPKDSLKTLLDEQHLELAQDEERTEGVILDSVARYPGGLSRYKKWLDSVLVYPRSIIGKYKKRQICVIPSFIVQPNGSITDIKIFQGCSERLFNEEALRVMRIMQSTKRWIPGSRNGKPIASQVCVPIYFFDDGLFNKQEE